MQLLGRAILVVTILAVSILMWIAMFSHPVHAHDSWISRGALRNGAGEWCCGEGDCFPQVGAQHLSSRFVLQDGEVTPETEAQPSPDGQYWRCKRPDGSRRCFFAPPEDF